MMEPRTGTGHGKGTLEKERGIMQKKAIVQRVAEAHGGPTVQADVVCLISWVLAHFW